MDDQRLSAAAEQYTESFASLVAWLLTWWTSGRDPGLSSMRSAVAAIGPVVSWSTSVVAVLAVVAIGIALMVRRRGSDLADALLGLGRLLLVISAGWLVITSAWTLSDALARWIMGGRFQSDDFAQRLVAAGSEVQPLLALVLSVAGIAATLALLTVIVARFVLVLALVVVLPVAAAASMSGATAVFARATSWLIAALIFRPLASLICRLGLILNQRADEALLVLMTAVVTLLMAAAVLPVSVRLLDGSRA